MTELDTLAEAMRALRPAVEAHITRERVWRILKALADQPAPSTCAAALRGPVLRRLLAEDGTLGRDGLTFHADYGGSGCPVLLTGHPEAARPLWYFAHLDSISYLVQPARDGRYPLVPFCVHLAQGARPARAYRYDVASNRFAVCAEGTLETESGDPFFRPVGASAPLRPGDRVVPFTPVRVEDGVVFGQTDNAGGVAALLAAAPVLAGTGVHALLAFPDEEEGPLGTGNQTIGRGGSRLAGLLPPPELAIVADVQQAGGDTRADARGGVENTARLGAGALLAEFSSLARGAVTPPDLYGLARHAGGLMGDLGVRVQESNNAYSSRSDDVGLMLRTPNILLLGFPGFDRHYDGGEPRAHLDDVVDLAKAVVYMGALRPTFVARRRALLGEGG